MNVYTDRRKANTQPVIKYYLNKYRDQLMQEDNELRRKLKKQNK